jgi:hypothetical protein
VLRAPHGGGGRGRAHAGAGSGGSGAAGAGQVGRANGAARPSSGLHAHGLRHGRAAGATCRAARRVHQTAPTGQAAVRPPPSVLWDRASEPRCEPHASLQLASPPPPPCTLLRYRLHAPPSAPSLPTARRSPPPPCAVSAAPYAAALVSQSSGAEVDRTPGGARVGEVLLAPLSVWRRVDLSVCWVKSIDMGGR